ncbi:MAG: hypothetical protein QME68_04710, partial [Elusimicrobiota bacterium]|nr:hypothetical protein [Elusimicrobiota bacterium]
GNELNYIVGVEYPLKKDITAFGEIKGMIHGPKTKPKGTEESGYQEVYLAPGIKYNVDKTFNFYSSILIGLTADSCDVIFFIGLIFKV